MKRIEAAKDGDVKSVKIGDKEENFIYRVYRSFLLYWIFISFGVSIQITIAGKITNTSIITYVLLILMAFIYCFAINITTLFCFTIFPNKSIKIEILRFSKIYRIIEHGINDLQINIRRDYSVRSTNWVLLIYEKQKLLFKQKETPGWSYLKFNKIEELLK